MALQLQLHINPGLLDSIAAPPFLGVFLAKSVFIYFFGKSKSFFFPSSQLLSHQFLKVMRAAYSVGVVITGNENALFVMFGCALPSSFHFRHSPTVSEHFSFFLLRNFLSIFLGSLPADSGLYDDMGVRVDTFPPGGAAAVLGSTTWASCAAADREGAS